jgi:hypothetical protein
MSENIQCSNLFLKIFDSHTGGCVRECSCGITHFDISDNVWDWEDGELERLKEKASLFPESYIEVDGSVSTMSVGGEEIVEGCKCKKASKYESFIRDNAVQIKEYLQEWSKILREKADKIDMS